MNNTSLEYQCMLNILMTDKCPSMPENDLFETIGNLFGNYLSLGLYLQIFISGKRGQQFANEKISVKTF